MLANAMQCDSHECPCCYEKTRVSYHRKNLDNLALAFFNFRWRDYYGRYPLGIILAFYQFQEMWSMHSLITGRDYPRTLSFFQFLLARLLWVLYSRMWIFNQFEKTSGSGRCLITGRNPHNLVVFNFCRPAYYGRHRLGIMWTDILKRHEASTVLGASFNWKKLSS